MYPVVPRPRLCAGPAGMEAVVNATILWVIAVVLVLFGIVQLVQGQFLWGLLLIVAGCLVGPGGVSVFSRR
ncbi:MAG: hypothetical protein JWM47_3221 [Acidimicrobiales bacterium]|nr:hypothetical protein [Acidimicrobiales bacterium]